MKKNTLVAPVAHQTVVHGIGLICLLSSSAVAAAEYTCYRWVDGEPTGGSISVEAESQAKAERKAVKRYRDELGYKIDQAKCELSW